MTMMIDGILYMHPLCPKLFWPGPRGNIASLFSGSLFKLLGQHVSRSVTLLNRIYGAIKNCLLSNVVQDRVVQINPNRSWNFQRGRILGSFLTPIFHMLTATDS